MLAVENVSISFGGSRILDSVSFRVDRGEILGIIGPNGSGKSTLLNVLTGVYAANEGAVIFKGVDISRLAIEERARLGMGRTFQNLRLFKRLSVLENMLVPALQIGSKKSAAQTKAKELLELVKLTPLREAQAGSLSIGQQRLLEFVRTIMLDSDLILLDEPTAGLHPLMIQTFVDTLKELHRRGKTFVFIEHNIPVIMDVCSSVVALAAGRVVVSGAPQMVRSHPDVVESYLG